MKTIIIITLCVLSNIVIGQTIVDSYSESNLTSYSSIHQYSSKRYDGQSFTCGVTVTLSECKFYLNKYNSPTGNCYALIYAHTGTYGTSGVPTGGELATSDAVNVANISTSSSLVT